jgi:FAD/FMN-containing dehydrogenase
VTTRIGSISLPLLQGSARTRSGLLFWAIRGGGGNFGVVTCMRIKLHETRHMLAGSIVYPWREAQPVLRRYAAFAATMP